MNDTAARGAGDSRLRPMAKEQTFDRHSLSAMTGHRQQSPKQTLEVKRQGNKRTGSPGR
jgi:hypothetical protein